MDDLLWLMPNHIWDDNICINGWNHAANRLLSYFLEYNHTLAEIVAMHSRLAEEGRKALIAEARRLPREERLRAFARHSKLVTELYNAARRARSNSGTRR
jgi:hypothetical protein